ncbi:MAG: hypothetical protein IKF71_01460 [Bacilli bacterium]|nr:hypothetical protein [Bacilli bacterium]
MEVKKNKVILFVVLSLVLFVLQAFVYFNYTFESIGSKCYMTRLAFSSEEEELKWEKEYEECVSKAEQTKLRHDKYKNYEKLIAFLLAICSIITTIYALNKYSLIKVFIKTCMIILCIITLFFAFVVIANA